MSDPHAPQPPEPVRNDEELLALQRRVVALETYIRERGWPLPPEAPMRAAGAVPPPPPVPPRVNQAVAHADSPLAARLDGAHTSPMPGAPHSLGAHAPPGGRHASSPGASWAERFVGIRLAAVVGGLAVLGALGLFIKHAVDNEWLGNLGPWARFAAGLGVAALLLAAAEGAKRRWTRHAAVGLYGAGVAALFVTVAGGIVVLELFDAWSGALVGLGAAGVGAVVAARSGALVVAFLGVTGGFALPVASGILSERGVSGGAFLTAVLAVALGMVLIGPPRFAWLRVLALAAAAPLGAWWALESGTRDSVLAVAVVAWWGMLVASCVVEALRGRSARLNAAALVVASLMASLAAVAALAGPAAWTNALSYMPLGMALCLGAVALQFRDGGEGGEGDPAAEAGDEREVILALRTLGRAAAAVAPIALVTGLGVLLDSGAFAVCAAGTACVLALARDQMGGRWVAAPGVAIASVLALVAAGFGLVEPLPAWHWEWPEGRALSVRTTDELLAVRVGTHMLGALGAAVLLALPLARAKRVGMMASATAAAALVATVMLLVVAFGLWSGGCAVAVLAGVVGGAGARARRWVVPAGVLLLCALGTWWLVLVLVATGEFRPAPPLGLTLAVMAALAAACWALRRAAWEAWRPWLDAAALLVAVFGVSFAVLIAGFGDLSAEGTVAALLAELALGGALIALIARARRSAALALAALAPIVPAIAAVLAAGLIAVFARTLPTAFGRSSVWVAALALPVVGIALAAWIAASLGARASRIAGLMRGSRALLLVAAWATVTAMLAAGTDSGVASPHLVIAALAGAGAFGLWRGFRDGVAEFRWVGLGLFGLLALRLFVVDLRETSTLFRVGVLLGTGLVLVGTSIAYTLVLKPRRGG